MTNPPTLRQLTRQLRQINEALKHPDGGSCHFTLVYDYWGTGFGEWELMPRGDEANARAFGNELVPGSEPFDAVAAARRLLAAVRDGANPPAEPE